MSEKHAVKEEGAGLALIRRNDQVRFSEPKPKPPSPTERAVRR